MEARRAEETDEATLNEIRHSWCIGSAAFKDELLQRVEAQLGEHHAGLLHREGAQARAERIIAEELGRLRWRPQDLAAARKSDARKLAGAQGDNSTDQNHCRASSFGHLKKSERNHPPFHESNPVANESKADA